MWTSASDRLFSQTSALISAVHLVKRFYFPVFSNVFWFCQLMNLWLICFLYWGAVKQVSQRLRVSVMNNSVLPAAFHHVNAAPADESVRGKRGGVFRLVRAICCSWVLKGNEIKPTLSISCRDNFPSFCGSVKSSQTGVAVKKKPVLNVSPWANMHLFGGEFWEPGVSGNDCE